MSSENGQEAESTRQLLALPQAPAETAKPHDEHLLQLLAKEMPKQETNLSIDELDKMISESMGHDEYMELHKRAGADHVSPKRQRRDDHAKLNEDLELEFEKAIEDHHRETLPVIDERESLRMIASELQEATSSRGEPAQPAEAATPHHEPQPQPHGQPHGQRGAHGQSLGPHTEPQPGQAGQPHTEQPVRDLPLHTELPGQPQSGQSGQSGQAQLLTQLQPPQQPPLVIHDGVHVPANSELLNTNTAFAAYNALSSQLPPLATLASAHLSALPLPIVAPDFLPPRIQLLVNTLPTLDNLALQLLRIVAIGPYQKILDLVAQPDTPAGATYRDLTLLFEFTKKLYSEEEPFLTVEHLAPGIWKRGDKTPPMFRSREQSIELALRKVNLATFLGATLGTLEVGFYYLNEAFLDIFCPANNLDPANALSNMHSGNIALQSGVNTAIGDTVGKLLKPQAVLYLDLKTQAYILAIEAGERLREEILEDILPRDIEAWMLARRGTKTLTPTEVDFVERCALRKEILLKYPPEKDLSEEYEWLTFLKELFEYASKNMGFLVWGKRGRASREAGPGVGPSAAADGGSAAAHSQELLDTRQEELEAERQRVQEAIRLHDFNHITNSLLPLEIQEQQIHLRINPRLAVRSLQRRPWTREEENALRQALELKGPMWLTILELFGAGGKILEALKNRTQVQLKDKARNWKMFFLKLGLPVPKYLHKVTGDLDREDRMKGKSKMSRKTAAAPVPPLQK